MKKYNFLSVTGFTLLEMLIVITIIGILAGLAIPQFTKTIETAKGKEAYVMMETIRTAERMYYLDYNSYVYPLNLNPTTYDRLVPDYLPENPNLKTDRNWSYFGSSNTIWTMRDGGTWDDWMIQMYMNGDFYPNTNWPWPPN